MQVFRYVKSESIVINKTLIYFEDNLTQSFGITDLKMMSRYFDRTILFTENKIQDKKAIPPGIEIVEDYINWKEFSAVTELFRNIFLVIKAILQEGLFSNIPPSQLLYAVKKINTNIYKADAIRNKLSKLDVDPNQVMWYSFWFYDCIFQAILRKKYPLSYSTIRTHAGDLFEDSPTLNGKVHIRKFQLSYTDKCVSISEAGTKYLKAKYPEFKDKIICSRLGTADPMAISKTDPDKFVIVTCSHVRNVKRVHLVAEALGLVDFKADWYHFGEPGNPDDSDPFIGYFHTAVKKLSNNPDIHYHQMGNLPVANVLEFYKNNPVNLLLSTSSTEGIPVSMMEAISFGIPVISTDVGGCSEIVNDKTGILMDAEITPSEIADILTKFKNSELNTASFRNGVRKYWEDNFNQENNYRQLLQNMKEIEN